MFRIRFAYTSFAFIFVAISVRLFYWQIIVGDRLRAQAVTQYSQFISLPSSRGSIITSDGSPLVINQPAYLVYAKPNEIENKYEFVQKLSSVLPIDIQEFSALLEIPGRLWVPVAQKVDITTKELISALGLTGIAFEKETKRYYPEASMAAHLVGFVGADKNGLDTGYFGLEGYYNRQLSGKSGSLTLQRDPSGTRILLEDAERIDPENGRTLQLWLDKTIQKSVEHHLQKGVERYGAKEGSVIVMDPMSGGILAMASYPKYDPSKFTDYTSELYKNSIVGSSYEPGSTFKVLVMAKAIDLNVIHANTLLREDGPLTIAGYTIRTWNNQYHGNITASQALTYSSNVGMVVIGEKIGNDKLLDFVKTLGFGSLTGIDLQDEATPQIRPENQWTDIDAATLTFGQGIAVTPIQMVRAVGALANGGWLIDPKVVKKIIDPKGDTVDIKPNKARRVYREASSEVLGEMMVNAVDNGEAKWAKPKGYRIAGKTGTAQIPLLGHYDEEKTIASFIGFAPSDRPRFVMLVTITEPTTSPWGSETAAPVFFSIAEDLFLYYGIPAS